MRALQGGSSSATDNWFCKRPHPSISALHGMCRFLSPAPRNCAVSSKKADLPGFRCPGNRAAERPLCSGKSQKNWVGQDGTTAVIDERGELFPEAFGPAPPNVDVLAGVPKGAAIQMALRTLSPQTILLDELGGAGE